jgi:hypothetical protein
MRSVGGDTASKFRDASSKASFMNSKYLNTTSFNALNGIPKHLKTMIVNEGEKLTGAPQMCDEIWKSMRKNDFDADTILTFKMVEVLHEKHKDYFRTLLNVTTPADLFHVMDVDEDGYINEDEQILFFSVVKEKMSQCAHHLSNLQEYVKYKEVMKSLRKLEDNINSYQNMLRTKIYNNEMKIYHNIGRDKLDDFYNKYDFEFRDFNRVSMEKISSLRQDHEEELYKLMERFERATEALKFKPKKKLKELQTNEKLVAIEERVEEALNFRKELKDLEVSEANRVVRLREEHNDKQRNKLLVDQKKAMEQLERKLQVEENNLTIRMNREFDILKKQIHLHENEILRIQGIATKYAWKKGQQDGELKRCKSKSRKQNTLLGETKSVNTTERGEKKSSTMSPGGMNETATSKKMGQSFAQFAQTFTSLNTREHVPLLKQAAKGQNLTRFYIRQKFGFDLPINVNSQALNSQSGDNHHKIEKYLHYDKREKRNTIPALTSLYDNNLQPIEIIRDETERITEEEQMKRRTYINEKLMGDKKVAAGQHIA